ncbi:glycoside hydrolase family 16 protein [Mucilaginibacter terrae]|uniref:glycoside hydrolase family 16 protein n=1 Tax=Mucilaginibacter terrae TaxID=1955052 RepID=UPI00363FD327
MKKIIGIPLLIKCLYQEGAVLFTVLLFCCSFTSQANNIDSLKAEKDYPANPIKKEGWLLSVNDEFDGTKLNEKLWIPYYLRHRSNKDLRAEYKFENGCLVLQRNSDGCSSIQTFERTDLHKLGVRQIPTKINFVQQYGYFEIRAKSQTGKGHCIAFWLLGIQETPAQSAEIDVVEQPGHYGNYTGLSSLHLWGDSTLKPNSVEKRDFGQKITAKQDLTTSFNIYALEWTPSTLKYYLNNELVLTVPRSPQYKMGILISFYQGDKSWFGPVDKSISYPKEFAVDYFRAYTKKGNKY